MMRTLLVLAFVVFVSVSESGAQAQAVPVQPAPAPQSGEQTQDPPAPQGFSYDADGRRDPFVSLLRRGSEPQRGGAARPAGLAGLLVSEVSLRGIVASRGGHVAILQGADGRTYTAREGEKLFDGAVRTINPSSLVMLQQVNDPLSQEKQREVRKVLRQSEEAQ